METSRKSKLCEHTEYCALSKTICIETDFSDYCRMKKSELRDMPLLKFVKSSINKKKKY